MTKYYNSRVRGVPFQPGNLVYRSNDASHAAAGDDFSRGVWTYLLVHCLFCPKVLHKQFEKEVKVKRSDNELEFIKGSLGPYMTKMGI
nr:hypothetical protein [Tanacetum cinerariifolium]